MPLDFIKPQKVSLMCRECGAIWRTELMTELHVSAVGTVTHADLADAHIPLPCGHYVGVRGAIPGFRPGKFWKRVGQEWVEVAL